MDVQCGWMVEWGRGRRIGGLDCGWTNKRKGEVIVSAWNVSGIPGRLKALEGILLCSFTAP